jgi:hypothetical protein
MHGDRVDYVVARRREDPHAVGIEELPEVIGQAAPACSPTGSHDPSDQLSLIASSVRPPPEVLCRSSVTCPAQGRSTS